MVNRILVIDPGIYKTTLISGKEGLRFATYPDNANVTALRDYAKRQDIRLLHSSSRKPEEDTNSRIAFNENFDLTNMQSKCKPGCTQIIAITRSPQSLNFINNLQQALKDVNPKIKLTLANFGSKGENQTLDSKSATIPEPKASTVGEFLEKQIPIDPLTRTPDGDLGTLRDERKRLITAHLEPISVNIPNCNVTDLTAWIDKAFGITA